jgi:putative transposase
MPRKYSIKPYVQDGYYHIFNRSIDGRALFSTSSDYDRYISYLVEYLEPRDDSELKKNIQDLSIHYKTRRATFRKLQRKNFSSEIKLFAYCLLPDSFHLLIQQRQKESMQEFMRALMTRYSMYYNLSYKRKGTLFESAYKAVQIVNDIQLFEVTKTIHQLALSKAEEYSSYPQYIGKKPGLSWLNTDLVLNLFTKRYTAITYASYVEGNKLQ